MMALVRKILIPTDCSERTFEGIRFVATQLTTDPVECTLLHVIPHVPGPFVSTDDGTGEPIEPIELALDRLNRLIAGFTLPPTMQIEPAVRFGEPWKEVLRYATDAGTDLIVTASGSNGNYPARIGDLIARYSPVPVLMLNAGAPVEEPVPWEEIREQVHITVDDGIGQTRHTGQDSDSLFS
jgi:nucleotide-binding universal stress UspA family protein